MIFNSKSQWNIDFIKEVYDFGKIHYPNIIPEKNNNLLAYSKRLAEAIDQLIPLFLKDNNYNIII